MNYLNLFYYKQSHQIYNLLKNDNHPNLLFYNNDNDNINIVELILTILNDKFNIIYPQLFENKFYHSNSYYYVINCSILTIEKINTIHMIIQSFYYYHQNYKYIILFNFEKTIQLIQQKLQIIIENSFRTSKFIIIVSSLNKIINELRSRFCCIGIKKLPKSDTYIYFKNKNLYNDKKLKYLCDNNYSFNEILYDFKNKDIIKKIIHEIFKIYQTFTNKSHKKIKEISFKIKLLGIPNHILLQCFLQEIISFYKDIDFKKMCEIIHLFGYYDSLLLKSYRDIIYLESLIIKLYKIIYFSLNKNENEYHKYM